MRMRITSARSRPCGRGSGAGLCDALRRRPSRSAASRRTRRAEVDISVTARRRKARHRAFRGRIHRRRAFDPGSDALAIRTPLGLLPSHRRLEDRSAARRRNAHRRSAAYARSATRASRRSSAIRPIFCARATAFRKATSATPCANSSPKAPARVLVTTFASNVARIRAVAEAAQAGRPHRRDRRARDGARRPGRARMRLSRRHARISRRPNCCRLAARQDRRYGDRQPGRDPRRHGARVAEGASGDQARRGRPGDLFLARHSRQ